MSKRIEDLRLAVETMHRCKARHESSTPIRETFFAKTIESTESSFCAFSMVWEGVVESFALSGHPKSKRCYAWSYHDKGKTQYVTALEIPPVESPITAVRVVITAEVKGKK
jgi:hypothetical protein